MITGGFLIIEYLKGQIPASGHPYPAHSGMWERVYLTLPAAEAQVRRLRLFSSRKATHDWMIVEAEQWLQSPTDAGLIPVEGGGR